MHKALHYYTLAMAAFLTIAIFASYSGKPGEEPEKAEKEDSIPQVIKAVDLAKPFDFAGEPLPMDNFDVAERLDRELLETLIGTLILSLTLKMHTNISQP